jgi:hypothetical protein
MLPAQIAPLRLTGTHAQADKQLESSIYLKSHQGQKTGWTGFHPGPVRSNAAGSQTGPVRHHRNRIQDLQALPGPDSLHCSGGGGGRGGKEGGGRMDGNPTGQAWPARAGLACPFGVFGHCPTCSMSDQLGVSDHMMSRGPGTVRVSVSESLTESDGATGRSAAALPPHCPQSHWY